MKIFIERYSTRTAAFGKKSTLQDSTLHARTGSELSDDLYATPGCGLFVDPRLARDCSAYAQRAFTISENAFEPGADCDSVRSVLVSDSRTSTASVQGFAERSRFFKWSTH